MKGSIARCIGDLVTTRFGKHTWEEVLEGAGMSRSTVILDIENVPDPQIMKLVESTMKTTGLSWQAMADAFGDHWVNVYSQMAYSHLYLKHSNAKEFLLSMDDLHLMITRKIENAHPPHFEYRWKDEHTLHLAYKSSRQMIDILVGLIKGVGKHYKQALTVRKLSESCVEVVFP